MIKGDILVLATAVVAAVLVVAGLRKWVADPILLTFLATVASLIAAVSSFVVGFTIAWTYSSADLWVVLASIFSALIAAGLVVGTARLASKH